MAALNPINRALLLSVLHFLLWQLVVAHPAALPKRTKCYTDNCLRQLQRSSVVASQYCSSYLGTVPVIRTTSTITVTVPAYSGSPFTYQYKRSVEDFTAVDSSITVPPQPLTTQHFIKRASSTSFYPSLCTENPTAISSGCSCFLPTSISTVTATATATSALPPQCAAAANYGLAYNGFGYSPNGLIVHSYGFGEPLRGACCARCFATPGCVSFAEFDLLVNGVPGTYAGSNCQILLILGTAVSPAMPNPTCPGGSLTISENPPATTANPTYYDGLGPCGIPTIIPGNIL